MLFKVNFYSLVIFTLTIIYSFPAKASSAQWQRVKSNEHLTLWKSRDKVAGIVSVKAELIVHSSLSGFLLFLQDTRHIPAWLDNAKASQIITQYSENKNLFITQFKEQWPVKARHMVIQTEYRQNYDGTIDIFVFDALNADLSSFDLSDSIRVTVNHAHWLIKAVSAQIYHQFSVNPNGNLDSNFPWII